MGQGITHRGTQNIFDTGHHKAHFTGFEHTGLFALGCKHPHRVHHMGLANGLGNNFIFDLKGTLHNTHQRHYAQVVVEPGINNQCLQGRI